jgi:hypothetical protein
MIRWLQAKLSLSSLGSGWRNCRRNKANILWITQGRFRKGRDLLNPVFSFLRAEKVSRKGG